MSQWHRCFASLLIAATTLQNGCSSSPSALTQISVTVDSDLNVPDEIDRLTIEVTGVTMSRISNADLSQHGLPRKLSLVHDGGSLGPITVIATGWISSLKVVERAVELSFVQGETIAVRIELNRVCQGIFCSDGETCNQGQCGSIARVSTTSGAGGASGSGGAGGSGAGGNAGVGGAGKSGGKDGGAMDAGQVDAGHPDAGHPDGGAKDGGHPDAGPPVNQAPRCSISQPTANQTLTKGSSVQLSGACTDPETGTLTNGLQWSSDLDGALGSGATLALPSLSIGTHMLKLCATDPKDPSLETCVEVIVMVTLPAPPTASILLVSQGTGLGISTTPPFLPTMPVDLIGTYTGQTPTFSFRDSFVGEFATSSSASLNAPEVGRHRVTFTVTDNVGQQAPPASVTFLVLPANQTELALPFTSVNTTLSAASGAQNFAVDALAADSMAQVLASNPSPAIYRFDGTNPNATASQTLDNSKLPGRIHAIVIRDSRVYVGTNNGLLVCAYVANTAIDKTTCMAFTGMDIPDNQINSVTRFAATNGTEYLALGTAKGIFLTTTIAGSNTGNGSVLNGNSIAATTASNGVLFIAGATTGLYRYNPVTDTQATKIDGGPSSNLQAIAADSSGMIWVGSDNGLGRYDPIQQQWTVWRVGSQPAPGLPNNTVHSLAVTHVTLDPQARDVIWIGTSEGLSRFDPMLPSFMTVTMSDGLPSDDVLSIALLPNGDKVFGTSAGVALYSGR